ncbi:LOW QUALITY PROTEIN: N-formyl peptide receptor 2-like [Trichechus inunguis]
MILQEITFVLGILGNGIVIWWLLMTCTVTTISNLNLALADLSFTASLPFLIASMAKEQWPFGWLLCKLIYIVEDINLYGSIFLITVIALDRCIFVLHPVWAQNHHTVGLAKRVITGLWILVLVLMLPVIIFITPVKEDKEKKIHCLFYWGDTIEQSMKEVIPLPESCMIIRFIIGFAILMSIITICYGLVAANMQKGLIKSSCPLWVLTAVIVSFFLCWFPFQLVSLLTIVWGTEMNSKYSILLILLNPTKSLATFNSCLNPMLYVFVGQDFQKRLIHFLPARLERALSEDSGQANDTAANSTSPPSDAVTGNVRRELWDNLQNRLASSHLESY